MRPGPSGAPSQACLSHSGHEPLKLVSPPPSPLPGPLRASSSSLHLSWSPQFSQVSSGGWKARRLDQAWQALGSRRGVPPLRGQRSSLLTCVRPAPKEKEGACPQLRLVLMVVDSWGVPPLYP